MPQLSNKEYISILQIIIAILCFLAVIIYEMVIPFPTDYVLFFLQCSMMSTGIICLVFAFSTWFYNSDHPKTRLHIRMFCVAVLWFCFILIFITLLWFNSDYSGEKIMGVFDRDIFDNTDAFFYWVALIFSWIVLISLLIMNITLTIFAYLKYKRQGKRFTG